MNQSKIPRLSSAKNYGVLTERNTNASSEPVKRSFSGIPVAQKLTARTLSLGGGPEVEPGTIAQWKQELQDEKLDLTPLQQKLEYQKLSKECQVKTAELNELKRSVMILMTNKQEQQLEVHMLQDNIARLEASAAADLEEIGGFHELAEGKLRDLSANYQLEVQQLKRTIAQELAEHEQKYRQMAETHDLQIKQKLQALQSEIGQKKQRLGSMDSELQRQTRALENEHAAARRQVIEDAEQQKGVLKKSIHAVDTQVSGLKQEINKIEKNLKNNTIRQSQINIQLAKYSHISQKLQNLTSEIQDEVAALQRTLALKKHSIIQAQEFIEQCKLDTARTIEQSAQAEVRRRVLHNKLQDLKGNIRVYCRIRPPAKGEIPIKVEFPDQGDEIFLQDKNAGFKFDKVFQTHATNSDIYEEISQLVRSALDGFNVCVFAYGQTGSGKTYTMSNSDGMIPRAIDQLFESSAGWDYKFQGQFMEIYNETVNDLLTKTKAKHEIRHAQGATTVTNITTVELDCSATVHRLLGQVNRNKSVGSTSANNQSSRSHTIFRILIDGNNGQHQCRGVLNLIDLAGSERLSHSQVTGSQLKETQAINKSLACLGDVIYSLGNRGHVPYRNSKLTYLLQHSLSGDSKTLMFVNISPDHRHISETVNSLRFATKVNSTRINGNVGH